MGTMSIGGLASGLDTSAIIAQMMALERRPRALLDTKQTLIETRQQLLRDFQTKLRAVQTAAADLRSVGLWAQTQSVTSTDDRKVSVSSSSGAGVGGYQIEVSQLANAAQRTFRFASPASDGFVTIDGHATSYTAGMTAQEFATQINSDRNATVYAAALEDGSIVLSSRRTGYEDDFIQVTASPTLDEDPAKARAGRDALYTIDGVARRSSENVIRDAIPGVTVTLRGVTSASGPVTVSVGAPGADTEAIQKKVQAFVDAYNAAVDAVRSKLNEKSVPDSRTQQDIKNGVPDRRTTAQLKAGVLFGDRQLSSVLDTMRRGIYTPVDGLPLTMDSLADLGVSTGAVADKTSADTLAGKLTLDVERLTRALTEDPNGVRNLLQGVDNAGGWARAFESALDVSVKTDGVIRSRIDGADNELRVLKNQMTQMDQRLALRERSLTAMFTALEVAMAKSQAQGQWLSGQLAQLG
jgi:flagellar hook-associated protein 2